MHFDDGMVDGLELPQDSDQTATPSGSSASRPLTCCRCCRCCADGYPQPSGVLSHLYESSSRDHSGFTQGSQGFTCGFTQPSQLQRFHIRFT
eukprot:6047304-Prymnesium_polylepis.1